MLVSSIFFNFVGDLSGEPYYHASDDDRARWDRWARGHIIKRDEEALSQIFDINNDLYYKQVSLYRYGDERYWIIIAKPDIQKWAQLRRAAYEEELQKMKAAYLQKMLK